MLSPALPPGARICHYLLSDSDMSHRERRAGQRTTLFLRISPVCMPEQW